MKNSFLATLVLLALSLDCRAQSLDQWGFPSFEPNLQCLYFGENISGSDAVEKLQSYLASRPISSVDHEYTHSIPSVMVSTVKFAQSRERLLVRAGYSLDGKWHLEEVKGVKYQLADFVPPLPSPKGALSIVILIGGALIWKTLSGKQFSWPQVNDEGFARLDRKGESAVLFMSFPPETSAKFAEVMAEEDLREQVAAITALPPVNSATRWAVVGKAAAQLGCPISDLQALAADSPTQVVSLMTLWKSDDDAVGAKG